MADKLDIGALFPSLTIELASGGTIALPAGQGGKWNVVLFYRGHW